MRDRFEEIREQARRERQIARRKRNDALYIKATLIFTIFLLAFAGAIIYYLDTVMTQQADLTYQIIVIQQDLDEQKAAPEVKLEPLGEFTITHYCICEKCCGTSDGITATGTVAKPNHTIAVDPKVIPYGTEVLIDGIEYTAEDTGGAIKGNKVDIFVSSHEEAISRGVITREVWTER